jgi:hypothetical protein
VNLLVDSGIQVDKYLGEVMVWCGIISEAFNQRDYRACRQALRNNLVLLHQYRNQKQDRERRNSFSVFLLAEVSEPMPTMLLIVNPGCEIFGPTGMV